MLHNLFYMYCFICTCFICFICTVFNFYMQCLCMLIYPRIHIRIMSGANKIRNCSTKLLRTFGIIIILLFFNHTVLRVAHVYTVVYIYFGFCIHLLRRISYFDISYFRMPITMHINELFHATRFNPFYIAHVQHIHIKQWNNYI